MRRNLRDGAQFPLTHPAVTVHYLYNYCAVISDRLYHNGEKAMSYVDGFVIAVPEVNKEDYRALAAKAAPLFKEFGATRVVECWADDVPEGKQTDFYRAVQAEENETVVFSWIEYPSKEVRDTANEKMMADPRMKELGNRMPFDGKRMIYGGFSILLEL